MKARRFSALHVLATGVLILLVTLLVLFWARWGCEYARQGLLPDSAWYAEIDASGLFQPKGGRDPNGAPCLVKAKRTEEQVLDATLGITQYQRAHELDALDGPVYARGKYEKSMRLYYDHSLRMIVYRFQGSVHQPNGTYVTKMVAVYAGPKGVADKPDRKLGQFRDPLVRLPEGDIDHPIAYDCGLRQFFAIDLRGGSVRPGPVVPAHLPAPVDFGWPRKQPQCLMLYLDTPEPHFTYGRNPGRTLVLDAAGVLWMLNLDTLGYTVRIGRLPAPETLGEQARWGTPDDLFAYQVLPIFTGKGDVYAGCAVAVLSRDATAMHVEVFDANGTRADERDVAVMGAPRRDDGESYTRLSTVSALYFQLPGAATLTATKFVLESLHPPVLLWLSHFTSHVEAVAGHRSLFVLPNSFVAMKARNTESLWIARFLSAVPFLLPGLVIGIVLARLLAVDARRMGLPVRTRRLWMAATVLFALPAYVTYQVTRPKTARVTCQNCGRDRRVDWEKCHHCGSPWLVPELVPPAWRVIGRPEEQACTDPAPRPEETISREFDA